MLALQPTSAIRTDSATTSHIGPWSSNSSPGGWHLIGATPVRLFDLSWQRPALLAAGDEVIFEPIDSAQFDEIQAAVAAGCYRIPCETTSQ